MVAFLQAGRQEDNRVKSARGPAQSSCHWPMRSQNFDVKTSDQKAWLVAAYAEQRGGGMKTGLHGGSEVWASAGPYLGPACSGMNTKGRGLHGLYSETRGVERPGNVARG